MSINRLITLTLYLFINSYSALPSTCAKCTHLNPQQQVMFTTTPVNTFDISVYTCNQIKYLTAYGGQGDLSCSDTSNSITFQMSNGGAMRVLFGGGPAVVSGICCDSSNRQRVCNAPDKQADIDQLCRNLGYSSGTMTAITSNNCPEAHFENPIWTSDFISGSGSITHFTCTGCVTPDPPSECAACGLTCAKCSDLNQQQQVMFTTTPVNTFDISSYTCNQIKYLTAFGGQGDLSCSDTSNSITFQMSSNGAIRVLFGGGSAVVSSTCCDSSNPRRVCNAPDKQADIDKLCINLGYSSGTMTVVNSNSCPEAHFENEIWTSDFVSSSGSITHFTCTGCVTPLLPPSCSCTLNPILAPTSNPTPAPTIFPTKIPTKNPSKYPTRFPTESPTQFPIKFPTILPTRNPSELPTITPSKSPTIISLSPTKSPTRNPTLNPSVSPTNMPTVSPTLPEGAIKDRFETSNGENQSDESLTLQNENENIFKNNLLYIIACAVGLFICCIVIGIIFYVSRKRSSAQKMVPTDKSNSNIEGIGTNTMIKHMELGSVSPRSINSMDMIIHTPFGTASGIEMMNTNDDINGEEQSSSNDGNNDLFVTGAVNVNTAGGDIVNDNNIQNNIELILPELPNGRGSDDESANTSDDNGMENQLYQKQETNTGDGIPKNINKLCDGCGNSVDENVEGKLDENDGNWYCNQCWKSFYD